MNPEKFEDQITKTYRFLNACGSSYLVIGGLASSILGEPRLTADFDVLLFVPSDQLQSFLDKAKAFGFNFETQKTLKDAKEYLFFQMKLGSLRVDCLLAETLFEAEILRRSLKIPFADTTISVPSPEDFILLKLLVGREKDLLDAKNVAWRHQGKLDIGYLKKQASILSPKNKEHFQDRLNKLLKDISEESP